MINAAKLLILSAFAGALFNVSALAMSETLDIIDTASEAEYAAALDSEADLDLSEENSDHWWGGGWGGCGGWGGFGLGCGWGWGFPFIPCYFPWFCGFGCGGFGWGGCGGWGGGWGGFGC